MNLPGRRHPGAAAFCVLLHAALLAAFLQQPRGGYPAQHEASAIMLTLPSLARPAQALPPKPEPLPSKPLPAKPLAAPQANPILPAPSTAITVAAAPAAVPAAAEAASPAASDATPAPSPATVAVAAPVTKPEPAALQLARPDHAHSPQPEYPMALRELGMQGTVLLRVWVEPDGRPGDIRLARSSGQRLFDDAALRAVRSWRFLPARSGEHAVASWVEFPIRFTLI